MLMNQNILEIIGLIVGLLIVTFPIVACIIMWKYIADVIKHFSEVIEANTKMLQRLYDRLDLWTVQK